MQIDEEERKHKKSEHKNMWLNGEEGEKAELQKKVRTRLVQGKKEKRIEGNSRGIKKPY